MQISGIELRLLAVDLIKPFNTSYGSIVERTPIIVRVFGDGYEGWAECPADVAPSMHTDPVADAWDALELQLAAQALGTEFEHPLELKLIDPEHRVAVAALEMAVWDIHARAKGLPLWHVLGGANRPVPAGVVVGVTDSLATLADVVNQRIDEGYRRVKLKIGPGWDREPISLIRAGWPELTISADANGAYSPDQGPLFKELDGYGLQYLEQPFPAPDLEQSARLAESIATPICLDESLTDRSRVHAALARHPGFVINAKPSRLGGHTETLAVHRLAQDAGADLWCGGYLETGIGRAHLVAAATLPGFTFPGDISASARYWSHDIVQPEWTLGDGALHPTKAPGIGVTVDTDLLERLTTRRVLVEV
ncbi:MAG: o-succinylbenzoate synthase [Acidimicrobiia bacterium]|nr:o-succinylbenzoate synthase [Acidimicrobiia bacterium]